MDGVLLSLICFAWFVSAPLGRLFTELRLHFLLYLPRTIHKTLSADLVSLLLCRAGCAGLNEKGALHFPTQGQNGVADRAHLEIFTDEGDSEAFLTTGMPLLSQM